MVTTGQKHTHDGRRITIIGTLVNIILILLKIIGGILGKSQGLIADAVHSVSDLFTDVIVLTGLRIGEKEPDEDHLFGHARIETLASSIVGLALIATALYLSIKSAINIYRHNVYHPTPIALYCAGFSIIMKETLYHYTVRIGRLLKNRLIVANAWHHRSDSLSSIAVLVGVTLSIINPDWHILDSFAAILVSFFIIKVGLDILVDTLKEFTDKAPPPDVINNIKACAFEVEGVLGVHDLKVRTSGGLYQAEIHIVVDGELSVNEGHTIAKRVESCLKNDMDDFENVIIHIDPSTKD
jgi:cation diffusion facilitator family transporter